jgi:signal transduction histidine kinase
MSPALHTRIGLLAAGFVLTAIALLSFLAYEFQRTSAMVWAQRLNVELADYIGKQLTRPLLRNDGTADVALMKDLAMDTMMVNPSVELYLLDASGRVLAHALDSGSVASTRVDVAPIKDFLRARTLGLATQVVGDDPKRQGRRAGFSAATIASSDRQHTGYLYIILYGEQSRTAADQLERDSRALVWLSFITLACVVGVLAGLLAYHFLTRPLRTLIATVVQNANPSCIQTSVAGDEIAILCAEFERLKQRIAKQIDQLQDSDLQRRELIVNLSHDMRTPLAGIQGYIELACVQSSENGGSVTALSTALKHCAKMNKRIDDLLMVARLEGSGANLSMEVFSLKELVYDVVHGFRARADQAGVSLEVKEQAAEPSNLMFRGDIGLIERLLSNLLDNALGFTPAGGRVCVELVSEAEVAKVCVLDTGVGMSEHTRAHAFERHWSSRSSTGFGLAIVQRICRLHQIELSVRSSTQGPLRGTQFELLLAPGTVNVS